MNVVRNHGRLAAKALMAGLLVVTVGCSEDDGVGVRYPVSGTITYKGEPVPRGTVNFLPEAGTEIRPASGEIQPDGSYKLTTQTPGDGAMAGKYNASAKPIVGGSAHRTLLGCLSGWFMIRKLVASC